MLNQIKYDLKVILKRERMLTMMLYVVIAASILSFMFYYRRNIGSIGNYANAFFLFSAKGTPIPSLFMYTLPLLVVIPHGDINFVEENLKSQLFMKVTKKDYYMSKAITTFLVGFLTIVIFLTLIYVFMLVMLRSNTTYFPVQSGFYSNDPASSYLLFYKIYFNYPALYNILYILLIGVYGGFLATIAYCFSLLIKSKPFVYLSSFFISILCALIPNFFRNGIQVWAPQNIYLPNPITASYPGIYSIELGMVFWFTLYLIFIVSILAYKIRTEE
jgi:hypothetical protein